MSAYTTTCQNCGKTVAKTPNGICVSCKKPWAVRQVTYPPAQIPTTIKCKNCNKSVAKTPNKICINCNYPNWGYTEEQIRKGEFLVGDIINPPQPNPLPPKPISKPNINFNPKLIAIPGILLIIGILIYFIITQLPSPISSDDDIDSTNSIQDLSRAVAMVKFPGGLGTAFLITPNKMLTAAHVAYGHETVEVVFTKVENKTLRAKVKFIGNVEEYAKLGFGFFLQDFALLELSESITNIEPLQLGNSDEVQELDEVITIGHSQGDPTLSFTEGEIKSLRFGEENHDLFKHTIDSNPGNSGGPVILKKNQKVIGILVGGRGIEVSGGRVNIPQGENIANKINATIKEIRANGFSID